MVAAGKSLVREAKSDSGSGQQGKRKVEPATQKLADRLIVFADDWRARYPEKELSEAMRRAWAAAAFEKLCELETEQLLALASMPMELFWHEGMGDSTGIPTFFAYFGCGFLHDNPLLQALGAKDYERARDFFLANHGLSDSAFTSRRTRAVPLPWRAFARGCCGGIPPQDGRSTWNTSGPTRRRSKKEA